MYTTSILIDNLYRDTEGYLEKAISTWQNLPAEVLMYQPTAQSWSASQCLEHLNIYGRYYIPAIEKAITTAQKQGSTPQSSFKSGWLGHYFYNLMKPQENGSVKSKMKSPKNAIPTPNHDPKAVVAEFIDQQEQLLQLLEKARKVNIGSIRIPISIIQWLKLKLGDTLLFLIAHNARHVVQLEKAIAAFKTANSI